MDNPKAYFGLIFGEQCSCGNDKPPEKYKKEETHCKRRCPGDNNYKCGGSGNRMNIYQIGSTPTITTTTTTTSTTTPSAAGK